MSEKNENNKKFEKEEFESVPKEEVREVKVVHPYQKITRRGGFNFSNLFLGMLIIFMGIIFLGRTTGWFYINIDLWKLWPILIILFGLSILSRGGWVSSIITVIVILLIIALVWILVFMNLNLGWKGVVHEIGDISIERKHGVNSALISIKTGAGKLTVDGGGEKLVSGTFESDYLKLNIDQKVRDGLQEVTISNRPSFVGFGSHINDLRLSINPNIPIELELDTGAIDMDLDLNEINLKSLDINTGASSLNLIIGDKVNNCNIEIDSGASLINITLPQTVGVRLTINSALTSKNLNNFKKIDSDTYESNNYHDVDKIVNIDIDIGVSSLTIDWY